jgi:hypothetical protein
MRYLSPKDVSTRLERGLSQLGKGTYAEPTRGRDPRASHPHVLEDSECIAQIIAKLVG